MLVLIPHRDIRRLYRNWSGELFALGFPGAWSFPWAAPLAQLSSPLDSAELKKLAVLIRDESLKSDSPGTITPLAPALVPFPDVPSPDNSSCPERMSLFGPALNIDIPELAVSAIRNKALRWFFPIALGAMLVPENEAAYIPSEAISLAPRQNFKACALANMRMRIGPENVYSAKWKIGTLYWLPKVERK